MTVVESLLCVALSVCVAWISHLGLLDYGENHNPDYFGQYGNHDYSNGPAVIYIVSKSIMLILLIV